MDLGNHLADTTARVWRMLEEVGSKTRDEPGITRPAWSEKDEIADVLADNRIAELADTDEDKQRKMLESFGKGFDLEFAGFTKEFLEGNSTTPPIMDNGEGEVKFSEYMGEANNYVVLVFRSNIDWLHAQTVLGLKRVAARRTTGKTWSIGIGRVLDGSKTLKKLKNGK